MMPSPAAPLFCAQAKSTACGDTSANAESAFPAYKTHGWAKCWRPAVVASRSAKSWFALFCEKERLWSSHRRVEPSGYVHISAALRMNRPNPAARRAKPFPNDMPLALTSWRGDSTVLEATSKAWQRLFAVPVLPRRVEFLGHYRRCRSASNESAQSSGCAGRSHFPTACLWRFQPGGTIPPFWKQLRKRGNGRSLCLQALFCAFHRPFPVRAEVWMRPSVCICRAHSPPSIQICSGGMRWKRPL